MAIGHLVSRNQMSLPPGRGPEARNELQFPRERPLPRAVPQPVPLRSMEPTATTRGSIINTYA
jgi:hypothetical protein